jgi:DNA primase
LDKLPTVIPPGFIQDLLSRTDIVEVVGRHVELKKAGSNHKGLCPFHGEKSPSFNVNSVRQTYHCFGCGVHGNAIGFLMEHNSLGFIEAVEDLAQQTGMQVPQDERSAEEREKAKEQKARQATLNDVLERASDHYRTQLRKNSRAVDYLKKRGLTGEIAKQFALGFSPEGWRTLASAFPAYDDPLLVESGMVIVSGDDGAEQKRYDRFRDRIMFPIRNVQGEFIGFGGRVLDKGEPKYLNSPETPVFSKGRELYGLFENRVGVRQRGYVLVVEGYMDVVALAQHGFNNAVATLGTACTAEHVQKLFRSGTESVVFSFDGDAAGRRAASRALEAALPHATDVRSIKFLFLPAEHDPDSYVRELGPEAFEQCVTEAVPLSRQLMDVASEGCDFETAEGRARLLANAKPLWSALPSGLLKRQLLGDLARRAQLPDQELMGLWQVGTVAVAERSPGYNNHQEPPPADDYGHDAHPADYGGHESSSQAGQPPQPQAWKKKTEWKKDWKPGGKWKGRGQADDETLGMPRRQPAGQAEHALIMLFLNSQWWELLSAEEHHTLFELNRPHGELVTWLDRFLTDHGASPWAVLEAALGEADLLDGAKRLLSSVHAEQEMSLEHLKSAVRKLRIANLEAESALLSRDPENRQQVQALRLEIQALKAAGTAAA